MHVQFPLQRTVGRVLDGQELNERMETAILLIRYDLFLESNHIGFNHELRLNHTARDHLAQ